MAWQPHRLSAEQQQDRRLEAARLLRHGVPQVRIARESPSPVVSIRVKVALEQGGLHGVQMVPADVQVGDAMLRSWLVHMWRRLACMDWDKSVFEEDEDGHFLLRLDKLVLNERALEEVPLKERLAFRLAESVVHLFHRTVVDRVLALTPPPEGLRFVPVAEWGDSSAFR